IAILATRRRWLVTRRCAACGSSCSFQRLASMYSSSGSSIGNLRISCRYRVRLPSEETDGTERAIDGLYSVMGAGVLVGDITSAAGDPIPRGRAQFDVVPK